MNGLRRELVLVLVVAGFVGACSSDDRPADRDAGARPIHDASVGMPEPRDAMATDAGVLESIRIPVGEFVFDALAAGPETGELVLLLHGFPEMSIEWRKELTALAAAGYRAVAPDQRGYSPGARPTDVGSYSIVNLVGDTLGMAEALGHHRFHVVGHDWGGGVAWGVAGVAPDRVLTLTAVSTPHPAALSAALADEASCQHRASAYFDALSAPDASAASLASIGVGFDGVPMDAQQTYIQDVIAKPDVLDAALDWYRANVKDRNLTGTIGAVTVPTVYLWGTNDATFCRATAEATAQYVTADYEFDAVEGGGHWLPEANADIVTAKLIALLRRNPEK